MIYGSVCSGIEAATVAWHGLGWTPKFFSEIEKFPSAVLAHHYGSNMPGETLATNGVPNHGDFTKIGADAGPVDLLVGGTPCQSFSVAGKRLGLDDPRGNLALEFLALARRLRARWIVWENVPGVLSSRSDDGSHDFATFLSFVRECGYGFAYRVLDAQHVRTCEFPFAVPQRRRRVFLVGYLGDWRRAAAVLFEPEGMRGDPPPRREAGQGVAPTISSRPTGGGGLGTDGGLIANSGDVSYCVSVNGQRSNDAETETLVAHALRGEGFDASEDGTGRGTPIVPVAFDCKGTQVQTETDGASMTLRSMGHANSHQNAGGQIAVAIQERAVSENIAAGPDGAGVRTDGAACTLEARQTPQAVAWSIMPQNSGKDYKARPVDVAQPIMAGGPVGGNQGGDYIQMPWAVRRLTPMECERLQGFPDGYTDIPWRNKDHAPDGPRYKALGNSFAVNVVQWIGQRIQVVEDMDNEGVE